MKANLKPVEFSNYNLQLVQTNLKVSDFSKLFLPIESQNPDKESEKRIARTLWVSFIVLSLSIYFFTCIKIAMDCASNSRNEINKMKDAQDREITDKVVQSLSYSSRIAEN